jgi:hypothetical protein
VGKWQEMVLVDRSNRRLPCVRCIPPDGCLSFGSSDEKSEFWLHVFTLEPLCGVGILNDHVNFGFPSAKRG